MEDWVGRYMEFGSSSLFTVSDAMNQAIFSSAKIPSDSLKDAPQPDLDACSFQRYTSKPLLSLLKSLQGPMRKSETSNYIPRSLRT